MITCEKGKYRGGGICQKVFVNKQQLSTYCRLNSAKSAMSSTIHSGNDENGVPESEFIGNFTVIAPMVMVFVLFFVDVSPEKIN